MEILNKKNALSVYNHLRKEVDLPESLIVAMMANIAVETGGTFDYKTEQVGRTDPAYGLFQFDPRGGLYDLYMDYLDHTSAYDSAESQLNMMVDIVLNVWSQGVSHVGSGNVRKVLRAAKRSADEATTAFCSHILRPGKPHMERRLAAATEALELIVQEKLRESRVRNTQYHS